MRQAGEEIPAVGTLWRDLPPEKWSVSQKIRMAKKKEFDDLANSGGYRVCVDMSFHDLMVDKARASLVQQVRQCALCCRAVLCHAFAGSGRDSITIEVVPSRKLSNCRICPRTCCALLRLRIDAT